MNNQISKEIRKTLRDWMGLVSNTEMTRNRKIKTVYRSVEERLKKSWLCKKSEQARELNNLFSVVSDWEIKTNKELSEKTMHLRRLVNSLGRV